MQTRRFVQLAVAFLVPLLALVACSKDRPLPVAVRAIAPTTSPAMPLTSDDEPIVSSTLQQINAKLDNLGASYRVTKAELVTMIGSNQPGITLIDDDRQRVSTSDWVPADARRHADGTKIRYLVDPTRPPNGVSAANGEAAIDRAMATWNSAAGVNIPIEKTAYNGTDPSVADGLFGFGTIGTPFQADIVHAGWMPPEFFDAIFFGGSQFILGVTFTFTLQDPATGNDINGDHRIDVGFRETYYNNHFAWGINADPPTADVETVALHESGHGLSLAHFGKIFIKNDPGSTQKVDEDAPTIQFAPFAVMNATIFGQNHDLQGTDVSGMSTMWANWPNR